ncbi:hypothetical protein [Piscinibacter sakaiensis]|uniref:hypothetical protein n=1 Tax=Piscinibacter sakaiensis TaxID=1547922 RepID=UPI0006B3FC43|nr:hypothetical protein [Piscinibacter sakaiensis]
MNRRVLGSNVQWVDRGDELLTAAGALRSDMLAQVQAAGPTMLRYPGGLQSDVFHWAAASNEHVFTRATQPTLMSPQRLLELCEATGAEPLFTVNTITGTPDEAAAWVRQANVTRGVSTRTGRTLPRVDFWELGNEPYLKEALRPDLDREPEAWAAQVDATVRAMRAVDPTIRIGLPLSTERRNGFPVTAYPRFSQRVLATLGVGIDYVCTHAGFLPLQAGASTAATELATLAAALAVQDELAALRALLSSLRPGQAWPLAVTEYAPMLGQGATDPWMLSGAGALYLADLLRVLAATPEVLAAHHWSLSGNGNFGAIAPGGYARPAGLVMGLAQQALRGELLALGVEADSVATPSVGLVPARAAMPLLEALASRDAGVLRLWLVHKDRSRPAELSLDLGASALRTASLTVLSTQTARIGSDLPEALQRSSTTLTPAARMTLTLPPASVALLEGALA